MPDSSSEPSEQAVIYSEQELSILNDIHAGRLDGCHPMVWGFVSFYGHVDFTCRLAHPPFSSLCFFSFSSPDPVIVSHDENPVFRINQEF